MAKGYRAPRSKDIKKFRVSATRTKKINRSTGNTMGGIRF